MTRTALIVAHGQPSDPAAPEAEMAAFAVRVADVLPQGWTVRSATLADPDALARALVDGSPPTAIFPFFMADGWFIRTLLPKRLAAVPGAATPVRILMPFGLLPEVATLTTGILRHAALARGWAEADCTVILAAHGSGASDRPAEAARAMRDALTGATGFAAIRLGFIEQAPFIADALRDAGTRSMLLPLFVARWSHVVGDLPDAVASAAFSGAVLDPIGLHPDVPGIVARAILADRPLGAAD